MYAETATTTVTTATRTTDTAETTTEVEDAAETEAKGEPPKKKPRALPTYPDTAAAQQWRLAKDMVCKIGLTKERKLSTAEEQYLAHVDAQAVVVNTLKQWNVQLRKVVALKEERPESTVAELVRDFFVANAVNGLSTRLTYARALSACLYHFSPQTYSELSHLFSLHTKGLTNMGAEEAENPAAPVPPERWAELFKAFTPVQAACAATIFVLGLRWEGGDRVVQLEQLGDDDGLLHLRVQLEGSKESKKPYKKTGFYKGFFREAMITFLQGRTRVQGKVFHAPYRGLYNKMKPMGFTLHSLKRSFVQYVELLTDNDEELMQLTSHTGWKTLARYLGQDIIAARRERQLKLAQKHEAIQNRAFGAADEEKEKDLREQGQNKIVEGRKKAQQKRGRKK